ncbi:MAG TPA: response regulator transcription factor [Clostridia bacterium]|nr:response regulator transcription factor [Clostridia bacterium]
MDKDSKVRLLIADDHTIFRDGLRRLLESEGGMSVVGEAGDGAEAIAMVQQSRPDILILDLAMPRVPGLEALRELIAMQAPTRVIILTAAIEKRQVLEALQIGARGVVLKDAATQILMKAIRTVMNGQFWVDREPVSDVVQYLRRESASQPASRAKAYGLTRRETEILGAIVAGLSNKEIAHKFSLSEDTVKHHLTNIFDKVGVSSRLELALFAINNRLTEPAE